MFWYNKHHNFLMRYSNCDFFSQQDYEGCEVDENGKSEEMLYDGLSIQQPVTIGNSDFLFALSASD